MKAFKSLIFCLLITICSFNPVFAQKKSGIAKMEGKLRNLGTSVELEDISEFQYINPKSKNTIITVGKDSGFSVSVPVKSPGYFRLGRNKLYLSPGDNLNVVIDGNYSEKALFKGKGNEANNYLRKTLFPKAGSYLQTGRNIQPTAREMLTFIINKARERENELDLVRGVSKEFVKLEKVRINADIVNSISKVPIYARTTFSKKPKEFVNSYLEEFAKISKPVKDSILKDIVDPLFLQVEVYRDISSELNLKNGATPKKLQVMNDWKKANSLAFTKITPLNDKSKIPYLRSVADSVKTKKYRNALHLLLDEKMKFGIGDHAVDITVRKPDGTTTNLSALKGKVIYIDIWATWCGPCMAEMPHLETLKEKYASNDNVAIVSLSVDDNDPAWLRNLENRKPGGIQWRIDRAKLSVYEVLSIPRFILIDKNFRIAEMNAPWASSPELVGMIDKLISNKK